MRLPRVLKARRAIQIGTAVLIMAIGVQYTFWLRAHLEGLEPSIVRPPAVEAFLPIGAMLSLKHLVLTGVVDDVHPAGLAIFLGICLMSALLTRSFCSHLCPIGLASELAGRLGVRVSGGLRVPRWLDIPRRGIKCFLLGYFVWVIWVVMDGDAVATFRFAGHWQTVVTEAEYRHRIAEIDSPVYTHSGAMAPAEPRLVAANAATSML